MGSHSIWNFAKSAALAAALTLPLSAVAQESHEDAEAQSITTTQSTTPRPSSSAGALLAVQPQAPWSADRRAPLSEARWVA